jgi:glycine cleavage system regulatory protein
MKAFFAISVMGPDRPGIVSRVPRFLAERGANVETLETEVRQAPFSGSPSARHCR